MCTLPIDCTTQRDEKEKLGVFSFFRAFAQVQRYGHPLRFDSNLVLGSPGQTQGTSHFDSNSYLPDLLRRINMKITIILQIYLSSALMLVGAPALSLSAEATALQEIKIGYTSPSISTFRLNLPGARGFFRAEGLNVLMIVMRTNVIMTALVTRGIDYGTPATSVIRGAASDLPVKAVAVLTGRPDYFLAAKKEFKSLRDLKGKRIAIGSFGAAADIALLSGAPAGRVGPRTRRDSSAGGRGRFAFCRAGRRNRGCDCSEFPFQSAGGKIRLQCFAFAWGTNGDASVRSGCPRRDDSEEPRAGYWLAQGYLVARWWCAGRSAEHRAGLRMDCVAGELL